MHTYINILEFYLITNCTTIVSINAFLSITHTGQWTRSYKIWLCDFVDRSHGNKLVAVQYTCVTCWMNYVPIDAQNYKRIAVKWLELVYRLHIYTIHMSTGRCPAVPVIALWVRVMMWVGRGEEIPLDLWRNAFAYMGYTIRNGFTAVRLVWSVLVEIH